MASASKPFSLSSIAGVAVAATVLIPLSALAAEAAPAMKMPTGMEQAVEPNAKAVLDFYKVVVEDQKVREGTEKYTTPDYVSHARDPKTGQDMAIDRETGIKALAGAFQKFPDLKEKTVRVATFDDFVFTQVVQTGGPAGTGARLNSTIKKMKNGKIAEHWVLSSIPLAQMDAWTSGTVEPQTVGMEDAGKPQAKVMLAYLHASLGEHKVREGAERYASPDFAAHARDPQTGKDVVIGREAGIKQLEGFFQKFPDMKEQVVRAYVFNNFVFLQQVNTGTPAGAMLTSTIQTIDNGKLTAHWVLSAVPLKQAAVWEKEAPAK